MAGAHPRLTLLLCLLVGLLGCTHSWVICIPVQEGDFSFVNCNPNRSSSTFKGFDVDLIRWIAIDQNWTEIEDASDLNKYPTSGNTFSFRCEYNKMPGDIISAYLADMTNGIQTCAVEAGATTVDPERQVIAKISYPYLRTGLGVMIYTEQSTKAYDMWAFLKPFHWTLWLSMFATVMLLPPFVWVVENVCQTGAIPLGRQSLFELHIAIFTSFLSMFNLDRFRCIAWPSQLILVTFLFQNLVVISTYTANLAASLTLAANKAGITSVSDLVGKTVVTIDIYTAKLNQYYGVVATAEDWLGEATFLDMLARLKAGTVDAYLMDRPTLEYFTITHNEDCGLSFLPDTLLPFDFGYPFHRMGNDAIFEQMNVGIMKAQSSNQLDVLAKQYITFPAGKCDNIVKDTAARFLQLAGLWVVIAGAAGLGVIMMIYSIWKFHIKGGGLADDEDSMDEFSKPNGNKTGSPSFRQSVSKIMSKVIVQASEPPPFMSPSMRFNQSFRSDAGSVHGGRQSQADSQSMNSVRGQGGGKVAPVPISSSGTGWTPQPVDEANAVLDLTDGSKRKAGRGLGEGMEIAQHAAHSPLSSPRAAAVAPAYFNTIVSADGSPRNYKVSQLGIASPMRRSEIGSLPHVSGQ